MSECKKKNSLFDVGDIGTAGLCCCPSQGLPIRDGGLSPDLLIGMLDVDEAIEEELSTEDER